MLSHYFPVDHDIWTSSKGPRIVNRDIVSLLPNVGIWRSPFPRHIGFDDETDGSSDKKILAAIAACQSLLRPSSS